MNDLLEKERQALKKRESLSQEIEASEKMVDKLMERVASAEAEKSELSSKYEKVELRMSNMSQKLETKQKEFEKERTERESIEHSQDLLLKKMKDLQKENDQLVVRLEGLKTENECLISKNKMLENRVKNLEDKNKQQLQQINETLQVPLAFDQQLLTTKSMKDVERIEEIREAVESSSAFHEASESCTPARMSLSPPSLTVPTVNFIVDKRQTFASEEKSCKIVPTISEPSLPSNSAKEQEYTSTIDSQDAPTIPHASPIPGNSKAFAETFSRSGKKLIFFLLNLILEFPS